MTTATIPTTSERTLAELIEQRQVALTLSDLQIAEAMGYDHPSAVRLIKRGQMRLPMNKVAPLARALEVEPGDLMQRLLLETETEFLKAIEDCMGPLSLSAGEKRLLTALRKSAQGGKITPVFFDSAPIVAVMVG